MVAPAFTLVYIKKLYIKNVLGIFKFYIYIREIL
jgi:hypothetical protein